MEVTDPATVNIFFGIGTRTAQEPSDSNFHAEDQPASLLRTPRTSAKCYDITLSLRYGFDAAASPIPDLSNSGLPLRCKARLACREAPQSQPRALTCREAP